MQDTHDEHHDCSECRPWTFWRILKTYYFWAVILILLIAVHEELQDVNSGVHNTVRLILD
jgi:hypothetical protein